MAHLATVACLLLAACAPTPLAEVDEIFSGPAGRPVLCAANLDEAGGSELESILGGLARAADSGELIGLYAHAPGRTLSLARLAAVLDEIDRLDLRTVTYAELGPGLAPGGGVLLSFDDDDVASWLSVRELLRARGARVTFFVTRFGLLTAEEKTGLHRLAADGHGVEAHGVWHLHGPDAVESHGLAAYLADEVLPSLEVLRADGFAATVFAYPFGARTSETDRAILEHVARLRSVSFVYDGLIADPCPE